MKPKLYVWVRHIPSGTYTFFAGDRFQPSRSNSKEYTNFKSALAGQRAASRLLDLLYKGSSFRSDYESEAVLFQWNEVAGDYRPSVARTSLVTKS